MSFNGARLLTPFIEHGRLLQGARSALTWIRRRIRRSISQRRDSGVVSRVGIEPTAKGLKGPCSTSELPARFTCNIENRGHHEQGQRCGTAPPISNPRSGARPASKYRHGSRLVCLNR